VVAWLLIGAALADVPPEPGYVEMCTVERACDARGGESCGAWHGDPDACKGLGARGLTFVCRTAGASTWSEVWCVGGAAAELPASPRRGCGCDHGAVGWAWLGMLGLARRRRVS
jgi:hypothetical protein